MPGHKRGDIGRPGWVRRLKGLYGSLGKPSRTQLSQSPVAGWNDLASFMLLARLTLDSGATEPARRVCEERILRDARRLASVGFFDLFAVRSAPLRAMLEGEGVIERR
jgi:hypothetical protein